MPKESIIKHFSSSTTGVSPSSGDLIEGELAINTADEKVFFKNLAGNVVSLGESKDISGAYAAKALPNTFTALQTFSVGITAYGATFGAGGVAMQNNQIRDVQLKDYFEIREAPTISSGTLTLNLNNSNIFDVSLTGNITTMTISNVPSGTVATGFTLLLTADGTLRTVTWPVSVKWPGGSAPSVTSTNGKTDVYSFITLNNGIGWYGFVGGQNY